MMLTHQQTANRSAILEHISRGRYPAQARNYLRRGDAYCFNGLLIDNLIRTGQTDVTWQTIELQPGPTSVYTLKHPHPFNPTHIVTDPYGMTPDEYRRIAVLNDQNGLTLTDIARLFADHAILQPPSA